MMPHKGASTQHYNQQVLAKPHHSPSDKEVTTKSENQKPSLYSTQRRNIKNCT